MAEGTPRFPGHTGARVGRDAFLRSQLRGDCDKQQALRAIESSPAEAGVPEDVIDRLADSCIRGHVVRASAVSFVTGVPGGLAMAATMPVDMAQFFWHAVALSQKLAYLYGWPDLLGRDGSVDEEAEARLTLLIGAMMGARAAQDGLAAVGERDGGRLSEAGHIRAPGLQCD